MPSPLAEIERAIQKTPDPLYDLTGQEIPAVQRCGVHLVPAALLIDTDNDRSHHAATFTRFHRSPRAISPIVAADTP